MTYFRPVLNQIGILHQSQYPRNVKSTDVIAQTEHLGFFLLL